MNYQDGVTKYTSTFTDQGFQDNSGKSLVKEEGENNSSSPSSSENTLPNIIVDDDEDVVIHDHHPSDGNNSLPEETSSDNNSPKKKKKNSVQQRIDQLTYAVGERDQYNAFLQQQLAEKEALLAARQKDLEAYQKSLTQKDTESFTNMASRLQAEEQNTKRELKLAIESGDTDAQTELMSRLADLKSEEKALILMKQNEIQRRQDRDYYADQYNDYAPVETPVQPYPSSPPVYDEEFNNWVEENPWYQNDHHLRQEADQLAVELKNYCSLHNIQVSPTEFRNKVAEELRRKYNRGNAPMNYNNDNTNSRYVAPVSNGVNPMGQATPPGSIRLTKKQFEFSRTLPSAFPGETHEQKAKRYASMIEPIPRTEDGIPIYKIRIG